MARYARKFYLCRLNGCNNVYYRDGLCLHHWERKQWRFLYLKDFDVETTLRKVSQYLTQREIEVIQMRVLGGATCKQVGKEMNISPERVRQIEQEALGKIRRPWVQDRLFHKEMLMHYTEETE